MRKLAGFTLLAGFLLIGTPAQAQPLITVSCSSVFVDFRSSIQPDSATVQIQSDAGTETHSVTLVQGGTDTVTFPLDGQTGEIVTVTVTLVYRGGGSNVTSATQTLEGCDEPTPTPTPDASVTPTPVPTVEATVGVQETRPPWESPEPPALPGDEVRGEVVRGTNNPSQPVNNGREQLPATGLAGVETLLLILLAVWGLGFTLRWWSEKRGYRG